MRLQSRQQLTKRQLKKRYYDPKAIGSYSGLRGFQNSLPFGTSKALSRKWLKSEDAYNLHVPVVQKFPRRKVICKKNIIKSTVT